MNKDKKYAIIFDMDGIIFDTEREYLRIWTSIFKKYGYTMTKDDYVPFMGKGKDAIKKMIIDKYGADIPIDKMYDEKDKLLLDSIKSNGVPLKEGAEDTLKYLRANGYKIALATSAREDRLSIQLTDDNVKSYFDAIVCRNDVKNTKPDPEIFLKAAEKLGKHPSECIVIEDSLSGIEAAHNANMISYHVEDLLVADDKIKLMSKRQFKNIYDIINYI